MPGLWRESRVNKGEQNIRIPIPLLILSSTSTYSLFDRSNNLSQEIYQYPITELLFKPSFICMSCSSISNHVL